MDNSIRPTSRASGGGVPVVPTQIHVSVRVRIDIRVYIRVSASTIVPPSSWRSLQRRKRRLCPAVAGRGESAIPRSLEGAPGGVGVEMAKRSRGECGSSGDGGVVLGLAGAAARAVGCALGETSWRVSGFSASDGGGGEAFGGGEFPCEGKCGGNSVSLDGGEGSVLFDGLEGRQGRDGERSLSGGGEVVEVTDYRVGISIRRLLSRGMWTDSRG